MNLKLFLWKDEDRINRYGFAMALAENEEDARRMIIEKAKRNGNYDDEFRDKLKRKPKVFDKPEAYYFYGSW